jgi:hypothetical protein
MLQIKTLRIGRDTAPHCVDLALFHPIARHISVDRVRLIDTSIALRRCNLPRHVVLS